MVTTLKSKRDARLAIAALTPSGREVVEDAAGVVNDTMSAVLERSPAAAAKLGELIELLEDVAN